MAKIRAAILGYGRTGSGMHAGAIEHNRDLFEMVAACDIDPKRQKQASDRFGCKIYEDHHEMLKNEDLDMVSVTTRSDQHCQMACDCLAAGVNVLVTKPWAVDAGQAQQMVDAEKASGKTLMPWLPARWGCDLIRLKELMAEKAIGNVFLIRRAVCSFGVRNDWQIQRKYGGGYLLNWGAHIVDPPAVLLDSPVQSVYGRMKQTINPGDTEDVFLAMMNLENGAIVQAEYTISVEDMPTWFIQGDRGTIVVRGRNIKIYRNTPAQPDDPTRYATMKSTDESVTEETLEGHVYGDEKEIYGIIGRSLLGQGDYPVKPAHALALSRVFDAIRTSAAENRVVVL